MLFLIIIHLLNTRIPDEFRWFHKILSIYEYRMYFFNNIWAKLVNIFWILIT